MPGEEDMKISAEQAKAVIVLVQAVQVAQKRGAFDLNEASQIANAVNLFVKKEEEPESVANNVTSESTL